MKNPLVSVIIPTFNRGYCLERCIQSVISQTYNNIEIIVVDYFSSDNTKDIVSNFKNSSIFIYDSDKKGAIAQRSFGALKARGDYIIFVDSDDYIDPDFIEKHLIFLKEFDFDIVTSNFIERKNDSEVIYFDKQSYKNFLKNIRKYILNVSCCTKLIKSSIVKKVCKELYNAKVSNIQFWEDVIFCYGCYLNAKSICLTNLCKYHYVNDPNSVTKGNIINENSIINTINIFNLFSSEKRFYQKQLSIFIFFELNRFLKDKFLITNYKKYKFYCKKIKKILRFKYTKMFVINNSEFCKSERLLCLLYKMRLFSFSYFVFKKVLRNAE